MRSMLEIRESLEWIEPLSPAEAQELAPLSDYHLRLLLQARLAQPNRVNAWLDDLTFLGWVEPPEWPEAGLAFRTSYLDVTGYARFLR